MAFGSGVGSGCRSRSGSSAGPRATAGASPAGSALRSSTIRRRILLTVALVVATASAARSASAQNVRVASQSSLSTNCAPPSCTCTDAGGMPGQCTHLRNYDSGNVPAPTSDTHDATVVGSFVGYDSSTSVFSETDGSAVFGTLKGFGHALSDASGSYVDAGGVAAGGNAGASLSVSFDDYLIVTAPPGGGPVTLSFTQHVTSSQSAAIDGGGLSIDPCQANGEARAQFEASIGVSPLGGGSGGGSYAYDRTLQECGPPQVTGSPTHTLAVTASDGERVNFGQGILLNLTARIDGGDGLLADRALGSDARIDARNTANLYVAVLTPGASYQSGSGTVYPTPEAGGGPGAATALVVLAGVARSRSRRAGGRPTCAGPRGRGR